MAEAAPLLLAAINNSFELLQSYRDALEQAGYKTVLIHSAEAGDEHQHLAGFLRRHQPALVIYDLPAPYDENWRAFQQLRRKVRGVRYLLATTGPETVAELMGARTQLPILGKPFDLEAVVLAVQAALVPDDDDGGVAA